MIAFGPDSQDALARYFEKEKIPFRAVSTPSAVLKAFGQPWKLAQFGWQPALVGLDRAGNVAYTHAGTNMRDLPDIGAALDAVAPR